MLRSSMTSMGWCLKSTQLGKAHLLVCEKCEYGTVFGIEMLKLWNEPQRASVYSHTDCFDRIFLYSIVLCVRLYTHQTFDNFLINQNTQRLIPRCHQIGNAPQGCSLRRIKIEKFNFFGQIQIPYLLINLPIIFHSNS